MNKLLLLFFVSILSFGKTLIINNNIDQAFDDCEGFENIEIIEIHSDYNGYGTCCYGGDNGFIDITVSGGSGNYTYIWSNGETTEDLVDLEAGTYSVIINDENGCEGTIEIMITEPEEITISEAHSSYHGEFNYGVSCNGATDGFIDITVTGGTGNYTYSWSNGTSTEDLGDIGAGSYTVTVTDENGSSISAEIVLTESPEAVFNILIDSQDDNNGFGVSCNGSNDGYISFTITSGEEYGWDYSLQSNGTEISNANIDLNSGIIENLSAGDYEIFFIDENACATDLYPFTITEPDIMSISENHSNYMDYGVSCNGSFDGFIDITVTGGTGNYTYTWSNGETIEDLSNIGAGIYTVTVSDNNGCTVSTEVELTDPDELIINKSTSEYACGYNVSGYDLNDGFINVTPIGGTGEYVYQWIGPNDFNSMDQNISNLEAGVYFLTTTDENNCSVSIQVEILEPVEMEITEFHSDYSGYGLSCNGESDGFIDITVSGGCPPYIYEWSNGETTEDISNLEAGVYSIVATDENGNIASIVIELTEPETLSIAENHSNYTGYGVSCNGEFDGFIDVTVTGGTGTYTYNWNNGASSNEDLTDLAAGIYSLIATDENGCSDSIEVELTEPEIIQFSGIQSDYLGFGTSCNGSSDGFIYTMVSGGAGNYTYNWSNGETTEHIDNINAGIYSAIVTDENGCSASIEIEITEPEEIIITEIHSNYTGYGVSCNEAADGFIDVTVTGGTGSYSYNWDNGATTEDLTDLVAGIYSLIATDENGCSTSIEIEITETDTMSITESHSNYSEYGVSCNGSFDGFIDITVTGGTGTYTYDWNNGASTEDITDLAAGIYSLIATDENGCSASIEVELSEPSLISVNFSPNDSLNLCFGDANGFIDWNSISGGEPFEPCEGDNNAAAIENFTLNCSELTTTFDCDFTYIFDFSVGDICPESCGYCPDLLFGYEVIIVNADTNEEFNYNDSSLAAGNYLVRITDSINCTIEEGFVINQPEEVELDFGYDCLGNCINDSDGDEICDEFEIEGCDDSTACNYNPILTDINNDLCDYISCADDCGVPFGDNSSCTGCTIMGFCNYCPECTINDFDSCVPFLDICSDESACNYSVIEDYYEFSNYDESCVFYCEDCCEYPPLGMDCDGNNVDLTTNQWHSNKKIIKVVDVLGREMTKDKNDVLLLFIYEDGSIEKKFILK